MQATFSEQADIFNCPRQAENFTGAVRIDPLFEPPDPARAFGALVTFEPGARTAWHTHPLGQTLIVTSGRGWTQCGGEPKEEIRRRDLVSARHEALARRDGEHRDVAYRDRRKAQRQGCRLDGASQRRTIRGRIGRQLRSQRRDAHDDVDARRARRDWSSEELDIVPRQRDGSPRKPVTIWVVRAGDDLYVRSAYGRSAAWVGDTQARHEGRIWAGGIEKDVIFPDADPNLNDQIDAAYRTKYGHHGARYVNMMVSREARATTIKLAPRSA